LAAGDTASAVRLLAPVAQEPDGAAMLFPRRQGVALYAAALRCSGRPDEALAQARQAAAMPGEDVRSRVIALRELATTLAATGCLAEAREIAQQAVEAAYATSQAGERAASDHLVDQLAGARAST
jgi:ATP/maltotriose-dependent transcriptional regulator MalT